MALSKCSKHTMASRIGSTIAGHGAFDKDTVDVTMSSFSNSSMGAVMSDSGPIRSRIKAMAAPRSLRAAHTHMQAHDKQNEQNYQSVLAHGAAFIIIQ